MQVLQTPPRGNGQGFAQGPSGVTIFPTFLGIVVGVKLPRLSDIELTVRYLESS